MEYMEMSEVKKGDRFKYGDEIIEATGLYSPNKSILQNERTRLFKVVRAALAWRKKNDTLSFSQYGWRTAIEDGGLEKLRNATTNPLIRELFEEASGKEELFKTLLVFFEADSLEGQAETIEILRKVLPENLRKAICPGVECCCGIQCKEILQPAAT